MKTLQIIHQVTLVPQDLVLLLLPPVVIHLQRVVVAVIVTTVALTIVPPAHQVLVPAAQAVQVLVRAHPVKNLHQVATKNKQKEPIFSN